MNVGLHMIYFDLRPKASHPSANPHNRKLAFTRTAEILTRLVACGVSTVRVSTAATGGCHLVVGIQREVRRCAAFYLAGAVS